MSEREIEDRLHSIRERIAKACQRSHRKLSDVRILAVSKKQSLDKIRYAYNLGLSEFAENYVQEALIKHEQLGSLPVNWHFIGRIQSNKARLLAGPFRIIHSVERASIAQALDRYTSMFGADRVQDIFLQFNVAEESTKAGADELDLENLVRFIVKHLHHIRLRGIMVMPPQVEKSEDVRKHFAHARHVLEKLRSDLTPEQLSQHPLSELSMGTSQDFEVAIEEGSTWIRLGTELLGPREFS